MIPKHMFLSLLFSRHSPLEQMSPSQQKSEVYREQSTYCVTSIQYKQSKAFSKEVVLLLIFLEPVLCSTQHAMPDKAIIPQKIFVTLCRYVPYLSNVSRDISDLSTLPIRTCTVGSYQNKSFSLKRSSGSSSKKEEFWREDG